MNIYPSQVPPPNGSTPINSAPINPPLNTMPVFAIPIDWQRVRVDAAVAAMQGMLACGGWDASRVALIAVDYADTLIAELQKEVAK